MAFVWSIMNLIKLSTVQECQREWKIPATFIIKRPSNLIKDDYMQHSFSIKYQLLVSQFIVRHTHRDTTAVKLF